jgi:hypothetical protein
MYGVDIHVEQGDLRRKMSAMRIWLDEHRFEPSTFSCRDTDYGTLVSIEFKVPREAEAFAERFDGQANGRLGAHLEEESALSPLGAVS